MNIGFDYDFERAEKIAKWKKRLFRLLIWVISVALVILLAYLVIRFAFEKTNMADDAMEPTLQTEDSVLINKTAYWFSEPARFDVIIYEQGGEEHQYYCIRRIIGLPGERIQIKDGYIYINDELVKEPFDFEPMVIAGLAEDAFLLEENEYFVLGDHRNDCEDSRFVSVCNILRENIIGKAWIRLNSFAFVNNIGRIEGDE